MKKVSIDVIKELNATSGYRWFSPETMRFCGFRVSNYAIVDKKDYLFVSYENDYHGRCGYTIHRCIPNGHILKIGNYQEYPTARAAWAVAKRIVKRHERERKEGVKV